MVMTNANISRCNITPTQATNNLILIHTHTFCRKLLAPHILGEFSLKHCERQVVILFVCVCVIFCFCVGHWLKATNERTNDDDDDFLHARLPAVVVVVFLPLSLLHFSLQTFGSAAVVKF